MGAFADTFYEDQTFKGMVLENDEVREITFQDCTFENCSFKETTVRSCKFSHCSFKNCDLSLMKVDGSTFKDTNFEDSKVIGVNWVKASWGRKEIVHLIQTIDFRRCVLNYSTFMGLDLEKMTLRKCIARDVDFSEANLKGADCRFTDFENSQFRHTDLSGVDFCGATNYFIQPHLNTIKQARFSLPEAMSLLYNLDIEICDPSELEAPGQE